MQCKNCGYTLRTDYSFCPDCGARVVRKRITFKNLWFDLIERYFNVDNTFLRTFIHLFIKPAEVIGGYIEGVRKRYMNPISYFTIALTLGGIVLFLMKKDLIEISQMAQFSQGAYDGFNDEVGKNPGMQEGLNLTETLFEYQNLFYILTIPLLVLTSRTVFWNKNKYNFSEHFVINIYGYSHISIVINALYLLFFWNTLAIQIVGVASLFGYIIYFSFAFKRLFDLDWASMLLKLLLFFVVFGILMMILTIGYGIYLLSQPEFLESIKAAKEAKGN